MASARLSKLCYPFLNRLLGGGLCVKNVFDFRVFAFLIVNHNFIIYTLILPVSQLQPLQLITPKIR